MHVSRLGEAHLFQCLTASKQITDFPPEILAKIFSDVVQLHHDNFNSSPSSLDSGFDCTFNTLLPSPIHEILSITGVNQYIRTVAIHTPTLWTWFPHLNDMEEEFFKVLLERSWPYSFRIMYTDDPSISAGLWDLLFDHADRIAYLHTTIPEIAKGINTVTLLSQRAPALRQCFILSKELNVVIPFGRRHFLFDRHAPLLSSLTLGNIALPGPNYRAFPSLSNLLLLGETPAAQRHTLRSGNTLRGLEFCALRSLVLENCHLNRAAILLSDKLDVGRLENLRISDTHDICSLLASRLMFPETCTCHITFAFPEVTTLYYADASAAAVQSFIRPDEKFSALDIDLSDPLQHQILLTREGRVLDFCFNIAEVQDLSLPFVFRVLVAAAKLFTFGLIPNIAPHQLLFYQHWNSLSLALEDHITQVHHVQLTFPDDPSSVHPTYLRSLVSKLPAAEILAVTPVSIFQNPRFYSWAKTSLPMLQCMSITLTDFLDDRTRSAIVHLINSRQSACAPRKLLVGFSADFVGSLGYAALEIIRSILVDIDEAMPPCTSTRWDEEEHTYPIWGMEEMV